MWQIVQISACFALPSLIVVVAYALLGVWAASSKLHWFLRAATVFGGVLLLVPVRAYEPAAIIALASPLIVIGIRRLQPERSISSETPGDEPDSRPKRWRFGLLDLFLLMLLVAIALFAWRAIDHGYNAYDWAAFSISAATFAAIVVTSYGTVMRRRWWGYLAMLILFVAVAPFLISAAAAQTRAIPAWNAVGALYGGRSRTDFLLLAAVHAALGLLMILFFSLQQGTRARSAAWRRFSQGGLLLLGSALGICLPVLYWQMLWLTPFPPSIDGSPNHYARVAEIAQALGGNRAGGPSASANVPQLVQEAETLLQHSNSVVWEKQALSQHELDAHHAAVSDMRAISRRFDADSTSFAMAGDHDRAAELGLANFRLGVMLNRGGDEIHGLLGSSFMRVGLLRVTAARRSLSPEARLSTIAVLQRSRGELESARTISDRDAAICERAYGWSHRYECLVTKLAFKVTTPGAQMLHRDRQRIAAHMVLLETDLALRAFRDDHGRLPTTLSELVPDYLPIAPADPFDQLPLRYQIKADDFVVYSVSSDGRDDGGRFTNRQHSGSAGFDYDLETPARP
jgi:hypothetical protein